MSNYVAIRMRKVSDGSDFKFCVNDTEIDYKMKKILGIEWIAENVLRLESMEVQLPDDVHPLFLNDAAGKPYGPGKAPSLSISAGKPKRLRFNAGMEGEGEVSINYRILCYVSGEARPRIAQSCDTKGGGGDILTEPRIIVKNVNPV